MCREGERTRSIGGHSQLYSPGSPRPSCPHVQPPVPSVALCMNRQEAPSCPGHHPLQVSCPHSSVPSCPPAPHGPQSLRGFAVFRAPSLMRFTHKLPCPAHDLLPPAQVTRPRMAPETPAEQTPWLPCVTFPPQPQPERLRSAWRWSTQSALSQGAG